MSAPDLPAPLPADAAQDVGRRVAVSSALMIAARFAVRGIGILSALILVRLLQPEDFGLVALAAVFITMAEVTTQTGMGMAVVRRADADRDFYDTAWTLNLLRSLLLGGLLAATAEWQADLLDEPRISGVVMIVALTTALSGLASPGWFRMQRELRYDKIFRLQIITQILSFSFTLALAFILQSYWCLVLGNLLASFLVIPIGYWMAPHRPRFCLRHWKELLHFSKWMLASNACSAVESQASNLAIGRFVGLPTLGMWQMSYQFAAVPVTELAVPIRGPVYAGYARVRHDPELLKRHFLGGFGLVATAIIPLSIGIALVAPEIERIALGPAFAGSATLIALCALYAMIDALAHFTFNLFIILGAQHRMVAVHALLVLLRVPAVVAGALLAGAAGVGFALIATALFGALAWHREMARILGYGFAELWAVLWRSLIAAAVMCGVVLALRDMLPPQSGLLDAALTLAVLAACGAVTHVGTQALTWMLAGRPAGAERQLLGLLGQFLARQASARAA